MYNIKEDYEWDEGKRKSNLNKHGVDFAAIETFDWETALVGRSDWHGEIRFVAIGYIEDRLHQVVFTERGEATRIISLRRASVRERRSYVQHDIR